MANMYVCRVFKVKSLFKSAILLVLLICSLGSYAQLTLTNAGNTAFIDFSATIPAGVGNGAYTGAGFQPTPSSGRLDSDAWAVDSWSDGTLTFGGTQISGDFARGTVAGAVLSTGGFYAYTGAPASVANPIFLIQPSGGDFTPGTLTLRIYNNGTSAITQLAVAYDLFVRNDQDRSSSFNFQWSTDNVNYNDVAALDYTSPAALDAAGLVLVDGPSPSRSTTITSQNILPGTYFYLRWRSADVGGTGQRDEFGLDNINITATYGAICTPPTTQASSTGFSNVLPGQMDVNFTRGNGTGGLMVIAVENAALSTNPFNGAIYTANSNFGTGSAIGNGFVVYNSNAVLPAPGGAGSFTVLGLNPSTNYRFYFIEYNGVGSPCYQLVYPNAAQSTTAATANPAGYFKSRISGNWNNANTWNYSSTGATPWVLSDLKPTSAAAGITIDSGHTVTLVANESAAKLLIHWSGTLDNTNATNGGYRLTMVDKAGDDLTVNGTLKLYGNIPTLVPGLNAVVNSGGMVHVIDNKGDAASDDFARSTQVKFYTDAVFNWNTVLSFETSSQEYFTAGAAHVPVFRISSSVNVGSGGYTYIHGLLECNAATTWQFGGIKRFRNGIVGTANLTQAAGSGRFEISATPAQSSAKLGGAGTITLSGELQMIGGSDVLLVSNKTINSGSTKVMAGGYLNTAQYIISGTTSFEVVTTGGLGIGSAQGITTIAAGNIQTSVRTMSTTGTYRYTGISDQVTGNLLPDSVSNLYIQGPPIAGPAYTVTLSQPLKVLNTTYMLNGWVFNIGATTLTCNGVISYGSGGVLRGTSSSNFILTGGGNQSLIFEAGSALALFTMKKSGGTATWNSAIEIYQGIYFDPANTGTANFFNRSVTLKSTATHTAYFSRLYGNITNNSTSKFTVERYIPTGTDHGKSWQLLAVPIDTAKSNQTINQAWQDTATSANHNRYPGYGTMITGATNDPSFTLGFDAFTPVGSTMKTFVPGATGSWANIPNTKTKEIADISGYMVLVRGDRSVTAVSGPGSIPVPTVLRATGQLYYGSTFNAVPGIVIPANSFVSLGNPYACSIDFTLVFKNSAVDKTFYAWDPLLPGSSGLGGYQTISESASWMPMPGGTTNYPTGVPVTTIQSGQAVLLHATGGSPGNVQVQEDDKVITSENVFRQPVNRSMLMAHLYTASGALADGNAVVFGNQFSNDYDGRDAVKATNTGENFGIAAHSKIISILTRKTVNAGDTIHYQMWNVPRGAHKLQFTPKHFNWSGTVWLIDRFTGTQTNISKSEPTGYEFNITAAPGSAGVNRFYLVFRAASNPRIDQVQPSITVAPNPVTGKNLGVVFSHLPAGQYQVMLMQSGGVVVLRRTVLIKSTEENIRFNLPPATIPGVYRLVVEGRPWRGDTRVVVE